MKGGWVAGRSPAAAVAYFRQTCGEQVHAGAYHLERGGLVAEVDAYRDGLKVGETRGYGDSEFLAWLSGVDPESGHVKGQIRGSDGIRAAGRYTEKVVNNPKTVSVVASQNPRVAAALDALVDAQAEEIARYVSRVAVVRKGSAGAQVEVSGVEVETARVTHATSREGDPHTHVHLLINTRAQLPDGSWGAVHTRSLWRHGQAINELAQQVLLTDENFRRVLTEEGFTLGADGEIEQARAAVAVMSKRTVLIDANRARIETAWYAAHPGEVASESVRNGWKDQAWREGRKAKPRAQETSAERSERVRVELAAAGFDFTSTRTGGALAVSAGRGVDEVDRDVVAAAVVTELEARSSTWSSAELNAAVARQVAGCGVLADRAAVRDLTQDVTTRARAMSVSVLEETRVATSLSRHLTSPRVIAEDEHLQLGLAALAADTGPRDVAGAATARDAGLAARQADAVAAVAGRRRLEVIQGPAGSGKTRMLSVAAARIAGDGRELRVFGASRKAALVAAAEVGADGSSVHALLYQYGWRWSEDTDVWTRLRAGDLDPVSGRIYSGPRAEAVLTARSVAVVDEAGMLSVPAAAALTDVLAETGAAVRFLGDTQQLGAVGRGGVLAAAARWCTDPIELDIVHRFRRTTVDSHGWPTTVADVEYAALSVQLRERTDPDEVVDALQARGLIAWHPDRDSMLEAIAADATSNRDGSGGDWAGDSAALAVTAASNDDAHELNARIRARRVAARLVEDTRTVLGREEDRIGVGDRVVTRHNDPGLDVSNRQTWTVTHVHDDGDLSVVGDGPDRQTVRLPSSYVSQHVGLAYAATAHGNQGVTTEQAVSAVSGGTDAAGFYVGMTRGRTANTAHLVAEDWPAVREQLLQVLDRDYADHGLDAATRAAHTESLARLNPAPPEPVAVRTEVGPVSAVPLTDQDLTLIQRYQDHLQAQLERVAARIAERDARPARIAALEARVRDLDAAWVAAGRPDPVTLPEQWSQARTVQQHTDQYAQQLRHERGLQLAGALEADKRQLNTADQAVRQAADQARVASVFERGAARQQLTEATGARDHIRGEFVARWGEQWTGAYVVDHHVQDDLARRDPHVQAAQAAAEQARTWATQLQRDVTDYRRHQADGGSPGLRLDQLRRQTSHDSPDLDQRSAAARDRHEQYPTLPPRRQADLARVWNTATLAAAAKRADAAARDAAHRNQHHTPGPRVDPGHGPSRGISR